MNQFDGDFSFTLYHEQEAVVTNTSSSTITISATSKSVDISGTTIPALEKERLEPGKTMTIENTSLASAYFKVEGTHDYATYNNTGDIRNYRLDTSYNLHSIYSGESVAITNSSSKGYEVIAPYKLFIFSDRSKPAAFRKVINNGETLEFKNVSSREFNISFNHNKYDYATYNNTSELVNYGVIGSYDPTVLPSGRRVVTNQSTEQLEVRGPYDAFTVTSRTTPALRREVLQEGKSIKVTNNSNGNVKLEFDGSYDFALYNTNGQVVSYGKNVTDSYKNVSKGGSIVISKASSGSTKVIGPWEDLKWENSLNPALSKLTIASGDSLEVTNSNSYSTGISLNGVYDYAFYDEKNQILNHFIKQQIKNINVGSNQRLAFTNTSGVSQEIYAPYGVFGFHTRTSSVTYSETLLPGKSIELKNKSTNLFSNYLTGQYDYVSYDRNDNVVKFDRDEKSNLFNIGNQSRLVLTNVGTSALVIEGPRDAIEINNRLNPALIKQTLAQKENVEFKYTGTRGSATVHMTGKYDSALYDTQGQIMSYMRRASASYTSVGVTNNRLAVMNNDTKTIEAYGVYDLLEVFQRSTPVTFTEILSPGKSIELKNKTTNDFPINLNGQYDYVSYNRLDNVVKFDRDEKSNLFTLGYQSRLVLTNVGTSAMVIEGPYDAIEINNRSNPALIKQTLAPKENVEFRYTGDRGSTSVQLIGKYDAAWYDSDGQITRYSRQTTIQSVAIGGNRLAVMNSDTKAIEAYGVYDLLELSQRSTPVTFTETLSPGKSIELKNKTVNNFSIYLNGQYDYVSFDHSDNIVSFDRNIKSSLFTLGNQSRLVLTNVSTSTMVIEGPYDAIEINNRSNPALIKQTLAPKANVEFKYVRDRGSTTVHMTGKHDFALYNAQGQLTNYTRRASASYTS
ncbi:MAG TPA: hypothetical protein GX525_11645, partial [Bacilli bacterium]|nr:hypothetical protein [Bacilli bacterium]